MSSNANCREKGMNIPPHFHKNKSDFVFVLKGEMEFTPLTNQVGIKSKKFVTV